MLDDMRSLPIFLILSVRLFIFEFDKSSYDNAHGKET